MFSLVAYWCHFQLMRRCFRGGWIYTLVIIHWHPVCTVLNLPKILMAIRSSRGVSHFRPRVFHISLRTHKTQHTQPRGRKENKHGLVLAPSARREKFVSLLCSSPCICRPLWACIRAKFPQSHQECWLIFSRWPTWPESRGLAPVLFCWLPYSLPFFGLSACPDFCRLPCSIDWSVLPPLFCFLLMIPWDLRPLVLFRSCRK